MEKRTSAPARVLAALAVAAGFVLVIIAIGAALGGGDGDGGDHHGRGHGGQASQPHEGKPKKTPATYEIQEGDTLTAIAHSTGVPVAKIERLNPGIDPQILSPGEELKLR